MTDEQIRIIKLPNNQLTKEQLDCANKMVAHTKRALELATLVPGAIEELRDDAEAFCEKYGIEIEDKEALKIIILPELLNKRDEIAATAPKPGSPVEAYDDFLHAIPEVYYRYYQFVQNKLFTRDYLRDRVYAPTHPVIKQWRERQINRCLGSIGGTNESFVHAVTTFELADGCSVGCDFCGLGAGRLKQLFRYTPENAKLFKDVLKVCHEVIGDAAGGGMMYFATEPLDNPDYQQFEDDYHNEFGLIPQITTAVADRDIERTRHFVHELDTKKGAFIHRFTIRNLEMAHHILEAFTPEELLRVELLPQYPEAPGFVSYTVVGNEAKKDDAINTTKDRIDEDGVSSDPGTICCIDGFRINFVKKELSIFTPCHMTEENPNGIAIAATVTFEDGEDFRDKLNFLIDTYMVIDVPRDEKLKIYDYFRLSYDKEKGNILQSIYGGETLLIDKFKENYMRDVIEMLMSGDYTKSELAAKLLSDHKVPTEHTLYFINQLWKKGFIVDTKFFSH